jgi:hypothetical protein
VDSSRGRRGTWELVTEHLFSDKLLLLGNFMNFSAFGIFSEFSEISDTGFEEFSEFNESNNI